jgi:hypothetical protein
MSAHEKTMIKMLRPEDVWQPKLGAPFGNRNAWKHGRENRYTRGLRRRIADWKKRVRATVTNVPS